MALPNLSRLSLCDHALLPIDAKRGADGKDAAPNKTPKTSRPSEMTSLADLSEYLRDSIKLPPSDGQLVAVQRFMNMFWRPKLDAEDGAYELPARGADWVAYMPGVLRSLVAQDTQSVDARAKAADLLRVIVVGLRLGEDEVEESLKVLMGVVRASEVAPTVLLSAMRNIGMFLRPSEEFAESEIAPHDGVHWVRRRFAAGCLASDGDDEGSFVQAALTATKMTFNYSTSQEVREVGQRAAKVLNDVLSWAKVVDDPVSSNPLLEMRIAKLLKANGIEILLESILTFTEKGVLRKGAWYFFLDFYLPATSLLRELVASDNGASRFVTADGVARLLNVAQQEALLESRFGGWSATQILRYNRSYESAFQTLEVVLRRGHAKEFMNASIWSRGLPVLLYTYQELFEIKWELAYENFSVRIELLLRLCETVAEVGAEYHDRLVEFFVPAFADLMNTKVVKGAVLGNNYLSWLARILWQFTQVFVRISAYSDTAATLVPKSLNSPARRLEWVNMLLGPLLRGSITENLPGMGGAFRTNVIEMLCDLLSYDYETYWVLLSRTPIAKVAVEGLLNIWRSPPTYNIEDSTLLGGALTKLLRSLTEDGPGEVVAVATRRLIAEKRAFGLLLFKESLPRYAVASDRWEKRHVDCVHLLCNLLESGRDLDTIGYRWWERLRSQEQGTPLATPSKHSLATILLDAARPDASAWDIGESRGYSRDAMQTAALRALRRYAEVGAPDAAIAICEAEGDDFLRDVLCKSALLASGTGRHEYTAYPEVEVTAAHFPLAALALSAITRCAPWWPKEIQERNAYRIDYPGDSCTKFAMHDVREGGVLSAIDRLAAANLIIQRSFVFHSQDAYYGEEEAIKRIVTEVAGGVGAALSQDAWFALMDFRFLNADVRHPGHSSDGTLDFGDALKKVVDAATVPNLARLLTGAGTGAQQLNAMGVLQALLGTSNGAADFLTFLTTTERGTAVTHALDNGSGLSKLIEIFYNLDRVGDWRDDDETAFALANLLEVALHPNTKRRSTYLPHLVNTKVVKLLTNMSNDWGSECKQIALNTDELVLSAMHSLFTSRDALALWAANFTDDLPLVTAMSVDSLGVGFLVATVSHTFHSNAKNTLDGDVRCGDESELSARARKAQVTLQALADFASDANSGMLGRTLRRDFWANFQNLIRMCSPALDKSGYGYLQENADTLMLSLTALVASNWTSNYKSDYLPGFGMPLVHMSHTQKSHEMTFDVSLLLREVLTPAARKMKNVEDMREMQKRIVRVENDGHDALHYKWGCSLSCTVSSLLDLKVKVGILDAAESAALKEDGLKRLAEAQEAAKMSDEDLRFVGEMERRSVERWRLSSSILLSILQCETDSWWAHERLQYVHAIGIYLREIAPGRDVDGDRRLVAMTIIQEVARKPPFIDAALEDIDKYSGDPWNGDGIRNLWTLVKQDDAPIQERHLAVQTLASLLVTADIDEIQLLSMGDVEAWKTYLSTRWKIESNDCDELERVVSDTAKVRAMFNSHPSFYDALHELVHDASANQPGCWKGFSDATKDVVGRMLADRGFLVAAALAPDNPSEWAGVVLGRQIAEEAKRRTDSFQAAFTIPNQPGEDAGGQNAFGQDASKIALEALRVFNGDLVSLGGGYRTWLAGIRAVHGMGYSPAWVEGATDALLDRAIDIVVQVAEQIIESAPIMEQELSLVTRLQGAHDPPGGKGPFGAKRVEKYTDAEKELSELLFVPETGLAALINSEDGPYWAWELYQVRAKQVPVIMAEAAAKAKAAAAAIS